MYVCGFHSTPAHGGCVLLKLCESLRSLAKKSFQRRLRYDRKAAFLKFDIKRINKQVQYKRTIVGLNIVNYAPSFGKFHNKYSL